MATLLCPQFTCPTPDNPFLIEDDLGMYVQGQQPAFLPDETGMTKTPTGGNSELDDLLGCTSADFLNDWLSFPDFLSDSSPGVLCSPESAASNYSSGPSSPSISLTGQQPDDLFQVLDGNHPASCSSSSALKPTFDTHYYPTLAQPSSLPAFFSGEVFPPCDSPSFTSSPSPTPPPPCTSVPVKKESPVLTSLLGKRPATTYDEKSASKAASVSKQQRIRKKLPQSVMKQRKKEQNKDAALRYRQRKKEQQDVLDQKCLVLEKKNSDLQGQVSDLTREIVYLKNLWQEVVAAKQQQHKSGLFN